MDRQGRGLFRGRFGTVPAAHTAGTPVIVFPFRYWDRWTERADAPELFYFGFSGGQPDAFWKRAFWDVDDAPVAGARLGVLTRTRPDIPWDADPELEDGLSVDFAGRLDAGGNAIGVQSSRVDWRAFVRYEPGAFDPLLGLSHGWKTTPRLTLFGAEMIGPSAILWRQDR